MSFQPESFSFLQLLSLSPELFELVLLIILWPWFIGVHWLLILEPELFELLQVFYQGLSFCGRWMPKLSQAVDVILVELELEPIAESLVLAVGLIGHIMQGHSCVRSL